MPHPVPAATCANTYSRVHAGGHEGGGQAGRDTQRCQSDHYCDEAGRRPAKGDSAPGSDRPTPGINRLVETC